MKVAVVGANGQIGQQVVAQLQQNQQHEAVALVRKEAQLQTFTQQGVYARLLDLTDDVEQMERSFAGIDAVIFSAGSGGDTDSDMTLRIDLDGAVKSMEAAEAAGVKRFILVSALQAHNREFWHPDITPYYIAKHYADRELMRSALDYTIVRPGLLTNDEGTGKVEAGANITEGDIARQDVARVLVAALDEPHTVGKAFDLIAGNNSIESVLNNL